MRFWIQKECRCVFKNGKETIQEIVAEYVHIITEGGGQRSDGMACKAGTGTDPVCSRSKIDQIIREVRKRLDHPIQ